MLASPSYNLQPKIHSPQQGKNHTIIRKTSLKFFYSTPKLEKTNTTGQIKRQHSHQIPIQRTTHPQTFILDEKPARRSPEAKSDKTTKMKPLQTTSVQDNITLIRNTMIRTLILAIVLFLIGLTIALNNIIYAKTSCPTTQNVRQHKMQRDTTHLYIIPTTWNRPIIL